MDKIVIHGGQRLHGKVSISGSKNAALPILAATLLTDEKCVITNVPSLADIKTTVALLSHLGKKVLQQGDTVTVSSNGKLRNTAPYELVKRMRASVLVMGPLIARLGRVRVSLPGGCAIGARPIDIHLEGFAKLGAKIVVHSGYVEMSATRLRGNTVHFRYPSVGATENIMLAGALAQGDTIIENAAREPEITDLACMLNAMGARINGAGTKRITIKGVKTLSGVTHSVIPDRIETATYLIAAAITKGDVTLADTNPGILSAVIEKLKKCGLSITCAGTTIHARWTKNLKPVNVQTGVHPGFPTDVQAQWMALMATVEGKSVIRETVFENRFLHVAELQRLGARMEIKGNRVTITGSKTLSGAPIMVSDLRAGAALVLAGLVAEGKTEISRIYHLDRGYENLEKKLRTLTAKITRLHE
ncbi:MAG: UDP-N-acetylglucosamine 1-carboxyvinyltransferase [Elusimicrobia bacterium RIFOXYA2_FULL_50_26]|nr:MAG: UDP-N-acetylglucosamine 1-carboxyvinyltransferase [Elusimicrobia bacterium RIFOXYA2_FULL_50_26]